MTPYKDAMLTVLFNFAILWILFVTPIKNEVKKIVGKDQYNIPEDGFIYFGYLFFGFGMLSYILGFVKATAVTLIKKNKNS